MIDKNDYFTQEKIDDIKKEYSNIIDFGMEEYENTETKNLVNVNPFLDKNVDFKVGHFLIIKGEKNYSLLLLSN